jgi:hypothetical protein
MANDVGTSESIDSRAISAGWPPLPAGGRRTGRRARLAAAAASRGVRSHRAARRHRRHTLPL